MNIKVAGIQLDVKNTVSKEDKEINIKKAITFIKTVDSSDLIVLPELFTIGYTREAFEKLPELADTKDSETISRFCELAKEKNSFIVFGFAEKAADKYYNSIAIINNKGNLVDIYRKKHIPQFGDCIEKEFFERGNKIITFDLKGVKIGVINCYDIRFPEFTRKLALEENIDLLIHASAFPKDDAFPSWHPFVITRAIENQIYILSITRAGKNFGNSIFCPPWINWEIKPIVLDDSEKILKVSIDTDIIKKVRETYQFRKDKLEKY